MIIAYNPEYVGDVLMFVVADDQGKANKVVRQGNIAKVITEENQEVVAWNIFEASKLVGSIEGCGQVKLSQEQLNLINQEIHKQGFSDQLILDNEPKIVIGFVKTCKKHPDSDHLSVTQTEIDHGKVLQIVCGADNIKAGLKVVVAKPGAMMPDGLMIWTGKLRGIESHGMICSARELRLSEALEKKGILELPFDAVVGEMFTVGK